ncbi:MAG TPA: ABC transporter permease [Candidatus Akkermansia intestinigallinarum]|uniref:ABC transporter permease n=1 Tax=Candidatus Akkermansia intestinigallinarum TaxID=2838431 RepID=A0A9D1V9V3_9BACT|nr:ABC transporter permease [Candidatus Akkermansia intestinigallinarum]
MISWILTVLYLAKDTLHRWLTRISSPLSRVLVVFFLTLCALFFLGNYVIITKTVHEQLVKQGGNLVIANLVHNREHPCSLPSRREMREKLGVDSWCINSQGSATLPNRRNCGIYSYDFSRSSQFAPLLSPNGGPVLLTGTQEPKVPPGPCTLTFNIGGEPVQRDIMVRCLPDEHPLLRLLAGGGVIVPPDSMPDAASYGGMSSMIVIIPDLQSAADIARVEHFLDRYMKLEGGNGNIISAASIIERLDRIMSNQTQCRLGFCAGITVIVGILLTALAGMEYRQNEYVYTLMKSFGIHPLMLVGAYLIENTLLVLSAFAAALLVFLRVQHIIISQFFKIESDGLSLAEIRPEIELISCSLLACIIVSSIPIFIAANRQIGRVLK